MAEPSGAVAVAGFLFHRDQLPKTKLNVAIISGGNIEPRCWQRCASNETETKHETLQAHVHSSRIIYSYETAI